MPERSGLPAGLDGRAGRPLGCTASTYFHEPFGLVRHPQLEPDVKQVILASWARDINAAEIEPTLLQPPEVGRPMRDLFGGRC